MWTSIFWFEIRYQLRQPLFYLVTFFFSLLVFLMATRDGVGQAAGEIYLNASTVTIDLLTGGSVIGLFVVIAFVASGAVRDFDQRSSELFFSKPVSPFDYLSGRFVGSLAISLLMFSLCATTLAVSSFMPWLDPELVGPFMWTPYLFALGIMILPTLFCLAAVSFALASRTRSMLMTYLSVIGLFTANLLARFFASDLDSTGVGQLLDPFGTEALRATVQYWTITERNAAIPDIGGLLLYNRLLWIGVGLLALGHSIVTFDPASAKNRRGKRRPESRDVELRDTSHDVKLPVAKTLFSRHTRVTQFLYQTRFEVVSVFKSIPFIGMLAFGLFIVVGGANSIGQEFGTGVYPLTYFMLEAIRGGYGVLLVIIAMLYSGEIIWKERSLECSHIIDAAPTPNGIFMGAKLTALVMVMTTFVLSGVVATLCVQIWRGYYHFELGLYAKGAASILVYPVLICFLACFFQIIARSKFMGYGLMIAFMLTWDLIEEFGFEHHLYRFASVPTLPYSEMNGYGHFLTPFSWFSFYWALFSFVLLGLSILFWKRGTDTAWKTRWYEARRRLRGPVRGLIAVGSIGFVLVGCWIFYNTNVLNQYLPSDVAETRQVDYEKSYRQHKNMAQLRIKAVQADVDLFPGERSVEIRGTYRMQNESAAPIQDLHFNLSDRVQINRLDLPPHQINTEDRDLGYYIFQFDPPIAPGEVITFGFDLTVEHRGFVNHRSSTSVVANGTHFDSRDSLYFPVIGYTDRRELEDRNARRQHGLEPDRRFAKIDDDLARSNTFLLGANGDWIDFETTVSTHVDQIAIAPGSLQKTWAEGDRRYFHYKMDVPILNFFAYMSAQYEVRREVWNDVAIEIYHHPDHTYNVDRIISTVKTSLDYFTENFGPYQFENLRIVEVPRYVNFGARAFPGTIPFSEAAGFVAQLDDEDAFDILFRRTSHELAHQWWGNQVIGGDVQGATMLSETLAEYSALMAMEQEYGPEKVRRFLRRAHDLYLKQRGAELVEEVPLALVEDQPYISYRKGPLAMYALKDALGEEKLHRTIRNFVSKVAFQEPPFTTTREFLNDLRLALPEGSQYLIEDLFETITLFDNKVTAATYSEQPDGTFRIRLEAETKKLRADGRGVETEIPIDDWIDLAVFGEKDKVLFFEKRRVTEPSVSFEAVIDERPVRVGIDPYHKLIDRDLDDNIESVSQ